MNPITRKESPVNKSESRVNEELQKDDSKIVCFDGSEVSEYV